MNNLRLQRKAYRSYQMFEDAPATDQEWLSRSIEMLEQFKREGSKRVKFSEKSSFKFAESLIQAYRFVDININILSLPVCELPYEQEKALRALYDQIKAEKAKAYVAPALPAQPTPSLPPPSRHQLPEFEPEKKKSFWDKIFS